VEQNLTTKLYIPPTRPELFSHPRLLDKLNAGARQGCKLPPISAPAGFGKTTLVSKWVDSMRLDATNESQAYIESPGYPSTMFIKFSGLPKKIFQQKGMIPK